MRYVIAGSLGNISKPVSEKLLATGHNVFLTSQLALELPELGGLTHKDFG